MHHLALIREWAPWAALTLLMLPVVLVYVAAGLTAGIVACLFRAVRPPAGPPVSSPPIYGDHPAAA